MSLVGEYSDSESDSEGEAEQTDPDVESKINGQFFIIIIIANQFWLYFAFSHKWHKFITCDHLKRFLHALPFFFSY